MMPIRFVLCWSLSLVFIAGMNLAHADDFPTATTPLNAAQQFAIENVHQNEAELKQVNKAIWEWAEVGLEEHQSASLLMEKLKAHGFEVEAGISNMPTAFVASYGSGPPIIGILAEYDALPDLSQKSVPYRESRVEGAGGHGCGHSGLGTGALGAAIAVKETMEKFSLPGTIRLYGTPAEETLIGKVYMKLDGRFSDLDTCLHWHPGGKNQVRGGGSKAAVSVKFTFSGVAAHASGSPSVGRSALDAVELMNVGVNYMREHVKEDARIHYVITNGGGQPNVVPPEATVWYYIRADNHEDVEQNFAWIKDIAAGAALMTQTTLSMQIDTDCHENIPNTPLNELIDANLRRVGPPKFTPEEQEFAAKLLEAVPGAKRTKSQSPLDETVHRLANNPSAGSTDVGDISWEIPTGGFNAVCHATGAPGHSWQVVACAGNSIGEKGTIYGAKVLAVTAVDLLQNADLITAAKADFDKRMQDRNYTTLIPEGQKAPASIR